MSQAAPQAPAQRRQLSIPDFWQLILNAQLMTPEHVQALQGQFAQVKGAMNGNAATLAEWLIAQRQLSRFQAKVLLSGQPGPFVFGQYRVYDRVEGGRLAGMFRAVHIATGQPVLLTFLSGPNAQNLERLQKAAKRAAINSGIHHPHVVRCLHFADLRAYKYLVLEDLHGQSLEELLAKGPIAPSEACRIARQAALGLMRLEELRLVHGELRPANIWINHLGTVKIIDFPMSRDPLSDPLPFDANTAANPASPAAAQADYLAPEIARGGMKPDVRADIYSLGCILYQMLTGQTPFPAPNVFQKILRHATEAVEPPDRVNANVPTAVSQLVLYMMAKDPNQRYQQASHVAEALVAYIDPNGLTMFADPPTAAGQAYEAWLTQSYPATEPDPDTGEYNFNVKAGEFAFIQQPEQPAASPFGAGGFGAPAPGGYANGGANGFAPGPGFAPNGGGFPQQGYPQQQGFPQPGAQADGFSFNQPGTGAFPVGGQPAGNPAAGGGAGPLRTTMTDLERERLAEEQFNKKMTNMAMTIGGTIVAAIIVLIAVVNFNTPANPDLAKESIEDPKTPPAKKVFNPDELDLKTDEKKGETQPTEKKVSIEDLDLDRNRPKRSQTPTTPPKGTQTQPEQQPPPTVSADSVWGELFAENAPQWASPTNGEPLDVKHLVNGCKILINLRPADMLASPEGKRVLEEVTLGPLVRTIYSQLGSISGVPFEEMESVLIGLMDGAGGPPKACLVVHTVNPVNEKELSAKWGNPPEQVVAGHKILRGSRYFYHIPPTGNDKVVVVAPFTSNQSELEEVVKDMAGERKPLLQKEIEGCLEKSDGRRHINIAFSPTFLFSGGKTMFEGPLGKLRQATRDFFLVDLNGGEYAKAAMLSFHLGDEYFYSEFRIDGGSSKPSALLARDLRKLLLDVPATVQANYEEPRSDGKRLIPTEYSRAVLARYPMMLSALAGYLRAGADGRQVVMTSVLPPAAAHNLALGTQLAVLDPGVVVGGASTTTVAGGPKDILEALKRKITLKVPSDSFDRIVPLISEELGYKIVFHPDLETRGITKNKRFGIDEKDKPIEEVLMAVCREANPTGGVKDMASPDMILVWVVSPDKKEVIYTIRENAKMRGTIPAAFGIK